MNARAKNSELLCGECAPLEIQFNINIATVLDMELMESSFDLMTNPLFKIEKKLDDANSFCIERCSSH
jgi:hypothetical protein